MNPAWSAPVVIRDGLPWLATAAISLTFPSAVGQRFVLDGQTRIVRRGELLGPTIVAVDVGVAELLVDADATVLLEVNP